MIVGMLHRVCDFGGIFLNESFVGFSSRGSSVPTGFRRGFLELECRLLPLRSQQGIERNQLWSRIWSKGDLLRGRGRGILEFSRQACGLRARVLRDQRSGERGCLFRGSFGLSGYSGSRSRGYPNRRAASDGWSGDGSCQSRGRLFLAEISHRVVRGCAPQGARP